jgi:hypothetical protein
MRLAMVLLLTALALGAACTGDDEVVPPAPVDAAPPADAGPRPDASITLDAGASDASPADASAADATAADAT